MSRIAIVFASMVSGVQLCYSVWNYSSKTGCDFVLRYADESVKDVLSRVSAQLHIPPLISEVDVGENQFNVYANAFVSAAVFGRFDILALGELEGVECYVAYQAKSKFSTSAGMVGAQNIVITLALPELAGWSQPVDVEILRRHIQHKHGLDTSSGANKPCFELKLFDFLTEGVHNHIVGKK